MSNISVNRIITIPKHFTSSSIAIMIKSSEGIFELSEKQEKGFLLDLSKVKQASMLGVLIIYKIIEYSISHNCFYRPMILFETNSPIGIALERYGFTSLILAYMADRKKTEKEYNKLKISIEDNFIIAPQALLRGDSQSKDKINKTYLPQIENYYSNSPKVVSMIMLVFSEILLNFWEHAVEDTKSIIVANGNKQNIEIACADTGEGIISSLGKSLSSHNINPESILAKSIKKGVTSKPMSNHMGYGLWILDEITALTGGRMHIYSQGAYYYNEQGTKKSGSCGYWQGTIIYLSLPLNNPKTLEDIEDEKISNNLNFKINWK